MTAIDTRNAAGNNPRMGAGNGTQTARTATEAADPVEVGGAAWDALRANPGASVTTIATAAGTPVPATRRALNALETAGHATRTPGGHRDGKRAPDAWHAIPATGGSDTAVETTGETGNAPKEIPEETTVAPGETAAPTSATGDQDGDGDAAPVEASTTGTAPAEDTGPAHEDGDGGEGMDTAAVTEARDALTVLGEAIASALSALTAGDRDAALAAAETFYSASGRSRRLVRAAAHRRARGASGGVCSAPGQLRAKVAAHLAAHPGKDFTPHEIGKVIGHSAGAIANALDRLAALGQAIETCERPRRFTATDPTTTGASAGSGAGAAGAATA